MKLWEAMLVGWEKVGSKANGNYLEFEDGKLCAACALGCAFLAVNEEKGNVYTLEELADMTYWRRDGVVGDILTDTFPELQEFEGYDEENDTAYTLINTIATWNDEDGYSVPYIAEILKNAK